MSPRKPSEDPIRKALREVQAAQKEEERQEVIKVKKARVKARQEEGRQEVRTAIEEPAIVQPVISAPVVMPEPARPKNTTVSDLNKLEEYLNPANLKAPSDPLAEELAAREREKIELARMFLSSGLQKTEVTASERKLIPLLHILAYNPFDLEEEYPGEHTHEELADFIREYLDFGIPLNRKGRSEEVAILKSLFNQETELKMDDEGGLKGKLRKFGR